MKNCTKIIALLLVMFVFGFHTSAQATDPYLGVWANSVKININNPTATSVTAPANYPVKISVPAKTYIDAGKMNADMRDIRFADSGGNPLPFWISITENMVRTFNNIPVYVKLRTFNTGDNVIYMYFDINKSKTFKSPQSNFTTSDTVYCGDGGSTSSVPYSSETCGDNTFNLFAYDCTSNDWSQDASCIGNSNKNWVSKNSFGTSSNATDMHFRTHFYTNTGDMYAYFLMQNGSTPTVANLGSKYCGYRLWYQYVSTSSGTQTLNQDTNILHLQKKSGSNCTSAAWTDVTTFNNFTPFNNSIQEFDIKTSSSAVTVLVNGNTKGSASRTDTWTGGYAGFNRGGWTQGAEGGSNSTDGISPIWITDKYVGADPTVTFVGNTDITIKRVLPTADASYVGLNVIEYTSQTQILEDVIDGNTLDKYVFNGYPAASPTEQIFKSAITIRNRSGTAADTFNIKLTNTGSTSQWNFYFDRDGTGYYSTLPGTGGTATTGSVTLAAGASTVINVIAIPTTDALLEGVFGRLVTDVAVTSTSDFSFDNARFLYDINGKTGCYWQKTLPIVISYDDSNGTGNLVDYQVQVNLTNFDFTVARSDGADVIFTDSNGTALSFWTKSFTQGTSSTTGNASYWVKVHNLTAGHNPPGSTTINMWWGNPSYSSSRSNKLATFDLWEDWDEVDVTQARYSVGSLVGCPDGAPTTAQCGATLANPNDPYGWRNNPQTSNFFNWWTVQNRLDGKAIRAYTSTTGSTSDFGPILSGGDVRWKSYEVSYSFINDISNTNANYNPVYFQDAGNSWGLEFFSNMFIFRPFGAGLDWTWANQINASALLGNSTFPALNKRYWVTARLFQNPSDSKTHLKLFISPKTSATTAPADTDDVATYYSEITPANTGLIPDTVLNASQSGATIQQGGMIGFGGWDGGLASDSIRVRKYTEPQPTCANGTVAPTNYSPITSLSMPVITPPLLNGRPVLLNGILNTFVWTGDLQAVYADCYIAGDCQAGEDATKMGTISLWGKVDDTTPKGFGYQLKNAVAGDNNRGSINDTSWQTNGRYIFTSYDSNGDGKISCTTTPADCIALGTSNAGVLSSYLGYGTEASPYANTTNLIKYVRGQYVTGFPRSDVRNQCSSGTADTCQWKLGDITHSSPLVVGVPNMMYADPAYDTFRAANSSRDLVTYTGSNEGMLHAVRMSTFDGTTKKYTTDATATELWAFVPNALLPALISTADKYHEYTNDGLLRAIDIKATGTGGTYKTVLIGGLRTGGQSLFAFDITDPRTANLMWEINNSTNATEFSKIGKTWSAPAVGRLCETFSSSGICDSSSTTNRWVAIIGSGFSPNSIDNLTKTAYLTFVDLETGGIIKQINVSTKPGNLTTNIGVLRDKYGYIQKVYFGDYYGAVWRIDLTTPTKVTAMLAGSKTVLTNTDMLFQPADYATSSITDPANLPQRPITSQPSTAYAKDSGGNAVWWVYFGTGAYDMYDSSYPYQRIYALKDTVTTPYVDTGLTDMTYTTSTNASKNNWFIELGHNDSRDYEYNGTSTATCVTNCVGQGYTADYCASKCKNVTASTKDRNERVISTPTVYGGFVFISTYTPSNSACGGGPARFYAVSYDTGSYNSGLILVGNVADTRSIALPTGTGPPSPPIVYTGKSGKGQIIGSGLVNTSTGGLSSTPLDPTKFSLNVNLLLWRRIR